MTARCHSALYGENNFEKSKFSVLLFNYLLYDESRIYESIKIKKTANLKKNKTSYQLQLTKKSHWITQFLIHFLSK